VRQARALSSTAHQVSPAFQYTPDSNLSPAFTGEQLPPLPTALPPPVSLESCPYGLTLPALDGFPPFDITQHWLTPPDYPLGGAANFDLDGSLDISTLVSTKPYNILTDITMDFTNLANFGPDDLLDPTGTSDAHHSIDLLSLQPPHSTTPPPSATSTPSNNSGGTAQGSNSRPPAHEDDEAALKRHRNTLAARKYRQKRLDRIKELEDALEEVTRERDELRIKLARQEAQNEALMSMLKMKGEG
jgi:hypothetical protein